MPARAPARQHEHPSSQWFGASAVQQAVEEELRQGAPELSRIFGRCGLQLRGGASLPDRLEGHRLHSMVNAWVDFRGIDGDFRAAQSRLPLGTATLSLVHLLHALECASDPVGLMAECARVIEPEGALLLLVFNPVSPFRLRWAGQGLHAFGIHHSARMVRAAGLEVHGCRHVGVWWRARGAQVADSPAGLPALASSYLMLARRRDPAATPLRLERKRLSLGASASTG